LNAAAARSTDARTPPFPWGAVLHFGLGLLRLPTDVFWSLSLRELSALGGACRSVDGMDRTGLATLMRRWPDSGSG
jgi:uncharacterized phage protein (TIGR02216 family)